ncbi:MAG TPA: DUF2780 domain-containing protein [Vicinamibacterales bacterium]|jgi:hypothetical protein
MRKVFPTVCALLLVSGLAAASPTTTSRAQATSTRAQQKSEIRQSANPTLVGELTRELNATPQQAEGAAGALFHYAQSKLAPPDWQAVAKAVPGMNGLLSAAEANQSAKNTFKNAVGFSTLADVGQTFQKLGLTPDKVEEAVPVLVSYVKKNGGAHAGQLLANALK